MNIKSKVAALAKLTNWASSSWLDSSGVRVVAIATVAITGLVLGMRQVGGLQPLDLVAFDQMVRWRPQAPADPRILIVAVTEADIRDQQKWPLSDQVLAQVLSKIQSLNPRVIGLDLYRDIPVPPGHEQLIAQLQQPNLIAIQNLDTLAGTPPPPSVPPERLGFNNIPADPDNIIRRNLLFAEGNSSQGSTGTLFSFGLQVAIAYLEKQGITPQSSAENPDDLQLGQAVYKPLQPNSGGYRSIEADGIQILLNYRTGSNVAPQVSVSDVLNGNIDPDWVTDKIVLIGSTAPSLKDTLYTPYSATLKENYRMTGVVVHAQMVSQFLDAATGDRPLFWFWSESQEILWIAGWVILGGILGWVSHHPISLSFWVTSGLVALFACNFLIVLSSGWVPLSAPAMGFILSVGTIVTYRAHQARQQQQIVMKLLGQNTSPEIAKTLWRGRDRLLKSGKLPGIRLTATMLFADVKDFSTISEQMTPEALLEWLNELLDAITHAILYREGIVNKFTGDGIMAVFGVPMSRLHKMEVSQDAQAAVACAMEMSRILDQKNKGWQQRGLPVIQMRIGIFTGSVVAGSLGGKDRLEYGVIGDSVNIAARLESCEKHRQDSDCRILIGHDTFLHVKDQYEFESWGALALKGKQQMVDVYRVIQPHPINNPEVVAAPDGTLHKAISPHPRQDHRG
jgi:adenylate cyclase